MGMARFCGECGSPLTDDARFCPECGAPVEQPQVQVPAEPENVRPAAVETAAQPEPQAPPEPFAPAAPQVPRVKKPLPKWVIPTGIAVVVVIVALVATSLILKSFHTPEKAMDQFLAAMDAGDFAALAEVARPETDETVFTEESTAPMFKLFAESAQFRKDLEECLEEDVDHLENGYKTTLGMMVDLVWEEHFFYTDYSVMIATYNVDFGSNLACTVQLDGGTTVELTPENTTGGEEWVELGSDYSMNCWSTGTAYYLLPGSYRVSSSVTTSFGDVFEAETVLELENDFDTYAELYFDFTSLDVYNDGTVDVDLYIGDDLYGTVSPGYDFIIAPIHPETKVEARADVGTEEPMKETLQAGEGYYYLSFILCEVEINNDYDLSIQVYRDGELLDEVPADDRLVLSEIPSGSELKLVLYDEDILEPYTYVCEYEYDYLYPEFELTDAAEEEVLNAVTAYTDDCLAAFNANDTTTLNAMANTDLRMMLESVSTDANAAIGDAGGNITFAVTRENDPEYSGYFDLWADMEGDGSFGVNFYCDIALRMEAIYTHPDGTQETDDDEAIPYLGFMVQHGEEGWTVVDQQ